jgi:hypothetical protein
MVAGLDHNEHARNDLLPIFQSKKQAVKHEALKLVVLNVV